MTTNVLDGPPALRDALRAIAADLSFSWLPTARSLFADLDRLRFEELGHNPTALLGELSDDELARAFTPAYAQRVERVLAALGDSCERSEAR
jgi:starch phosphorylase